MLMVTPTPDVVLKLARSASLSEHVIALSARHEDVNKYMNAADAAFMLRDSMSIQIASPRRPSSLNTVWQALPVIMTEAVKDACALAQRLGNYVDKDDPEAIRLIGSTNRETVTSSAREILGRRADRGDLPTVPRHGSSQPLRRTHERCGLSPAPAPREPSLHEIACHGIRVAVPTCTGSQRNAGRVFSNPEMRLKRR